MLFLAILSFIIAALLVYAFSKDTGKHTPHHRRCSESAAETIRQRHLIQTKSTLN